MQEGGGNERRVWGTRGGSCEASALVQSALGTAVLILLLHESCRKSKGAAVLEFGSRRAGWVSTSIKQLLALPSFGPCLSGCARCQAFLSPRSIPSLHPASASCPSSPIPWVENQDNCPFEVRPHSLTFPLLQTHQCGHPVPSGNPLDKGPCPGGCRSSQG